MHRPPRKLLQLCFPFPNLGSGIPSPSQAAMGDRQMDSHSVEPPLASPPAYAWAGGGGGLLVEVKGWSR